ncbi:hypothetical protein [Halobacillus seohaensis]|uniref:PhoD-like phosphatase metallophosphatase domain-containing protein n=1 Tax=Halobacillus seohaensis TaxID=447421 RepID=A0ABW2EGK9_9BACI
MVNVTLPTILSGPIIRRVDPTQVYIWIVLSEEHAFDAQLYNIEPKDGSYQYEILSHHTTATTMQAGNHCFVSLIKLSPSSGTFPTDRLIGYNLFFTNQIKQFDLGMLPILDPRHPDSLVYGNLGYPSFYINEKKKGSSLYGSCRKLHGKGEDALARADLELEQNPTTLSERPSSLFLTGDQIYADDVADPIISKISNIGELTIGSEEIHPLMDESYCEKINSPGNRQKIAGNLCRFTSKKASNHLLKFNEYVGMYLLNWSPELWPDFEPLSGNDEQLSHLDMKTYNAQTSELSSLKKDLPRVRRLLANTPTYMIMDDHDITDDWNISHQWKTDVKNAPLGRHVVANGLTAYWLFQGWGNDPESFSKSFLTTIQSYFNSFKINSSAYEPWLNLLWDYDQWHFLAPTYPKSLFFDTRTERDYKTGIEIKTGPILLSDQALHKGTLLLEQDNWESGDPLVIVSPTPVYGLHLIQSFLKNWIYPLRTIGVPVHTLFDLETWRFNSKGLTRLLQTITDWDPGHCAIISGDAHLAYSLQSSIKMDQEFQLYQFTSSPTHNENFTGIWELLLNAVVYYESNVRGKRECSRYCDSSYQVAESSDSTPDHVLWEEYIRYLEIDNGALVETANNIGLLSYASEGFENKILLTSLQRFK